MRITIICLLIFILNLAAKSIALPQQSGKGHPLYLSFEQRLVASYLLEIEGKPAHEKMKLTKRMKTTFMKMKEKGVHVFYANSFEEFLSQFRGEWPNTHSLDLDLQFIEKRASRGIPLYHSDNPQVLEKIGNYIEHHYKTLADFAQAPQSGQEHDFNTFFQNEKNNELFYDLVGKMFNADSEERVEEAMKWTIELIEPIISKQLDILNHIGEQVANSSATSDLDIATKELLQMLVTEYFRMLSPESKKLIVSNFMGENLLSGDFDKFKLMILSSGPSLQKLLQIIGRDKNIPKEMQHIFLELEDAVRSVPWELIEPMVESEKKNYQFTEFNHKPLGVGTMAQVHKAKMQFKGKVIEVVVRFLKPGIEKRVYEDDRILKHIAAILDKHPLLLQLGAPKMAPLIEDATETVLAELDQDATKQRQIYAASKDVYEKEFSIQLFGKKRTIKVHVPHVYTSYYKSQFMVQELVKGNKFDKVMSQANPTEKQLTMETLAYIWTNEAMFKSGFFHSDLHQGNFLVEYKSDTTQFNLLDFGMGGRISEKVQSSFMLLGVAIEALNPDKILQAFWNLSDQNRNQISYFELKQRIHDMTRKMHYHKEKLWSLEIWAGWALDQGLRFPSQFVGLNRGMGTINKLLQDIDSKQTVDTLGLRIATKKPFQVINKLILGEGISPKDVKAIAVKKAEEAILGPRPTVTLTSKQEEAQERIAAMVDAMKAKKSCEAVFN